MDPSENVSRISWAKRCEGHSEFTKFDGCYINLDKFPKYLEYEAPIQVF